MCGIYGMLSQAGVTKQVDIQRDRIVHRGPDDYGTWVNATRTVALAHRRLSIIDISEGSHQPFVSENGNLVVVFNGEIYNYREIRADLKKAGHHFRSNGDTEVLLLAFQEWGVSCVDRFNGMFAFAIYDNGNGLAPARLFIARDRVGKKPFYYHYVNGFFEFASELKAISQYDGIDLQALNHYLALGYVPFDHCIAKGVQKLLPGHAGVFDINSGNLKTWRYWSLPESLSIPETEGDQLAEESWEILKDSVRLRLRSDVPVGVFLSGGMDSSLITAAAVEVSSQPIKTFTISVPGSKLDESAYARLIADHFSTDHHLLELPKPSLDVFEDLAPYLDEPLADSSIIPAYLVSKLTAEHVKVALGGDGGDELYGGYRHYQAALRDRAHFDWVPGWMLNIISRLAGKLPAGVWGRNRLASLQGGCGNAHIWGSPYFDVELRKRILHPDLISELGGDIDLPERTLAGMFQEGVCLVDALTRTDFKSVLVDDFLVKVDRASMANSLEVRTPFLDYRLIEHSFSRIPSSWKVNLKERRRLQNLMARKYLPGDFELDRKQGFSIPMDEWMRMSNMHEWLEKVPCEPIINKREGERLVQGLLAGRANGARLFALMAFFASRKNLSI